MRNLLLGALVLGLAPMTALAGDRDGGRDRHDGGSRYWHRDHGRDRGYRDYHRDYRDYGRSYVTVRSYAPRVYCPPPVYTYSYYPGYTYSYYPTYTYSYASYSYPGYSYCRPYYPRGGWSFSFGWSWRW